MPKLVLRLVLTLLLSLCATASYAQDEKRVTFNMPCAQVLKLGLEKFMNVYGEKTGDWSTLGTKDAARYYYRCKRENNDARVKRLSARRRQHIGVIRVALNDLGSACSEMQRIRAGGGSIYGMLGMFAAAGREDLLGTVIDILAKPPRKSRSARSSANASMTKAEKTLRTLAPSSRIGEYSSSRAQRQQDYMKAYTTAKNAVSRLRVLMPALPDEAARRVAAEAQSTLDGVLESMEDE